MDSQRFSAINQICLLIVVIAFVGYLSEAAPSKKPNFFCRIFRTKTEKSPSSTQNEAPFLACTTDDSHEPIRSIQSLVSIKDIQTLRHLGGYVSGGKSGFLSMSEPKALVVGALSNMMEDGVDDFSEFGAKFRDRILRPCKQVHHLFKGCRWSKYSLSPIEREWLTIKKVCRIIVLGVDSDGADLIMDTYRAMHPYPVSVPSHLKQANVARYEFNQPEIQASGSGGSFAELYVPMKEMQTLRNLGALVQKQTVALEAPKSVVVVRAIASMMSNVEGMLGYTDFEAKFRDKFLKLCKQVPIWNDAVWWDTMQRKTGLHRESEEWLRIEAVCKFIVLNVDVSYANLIEDAYQAALESTSDETRPTDLQTKTSDNIVSQGIVTPANTIPSKFSSEVKSAEVNSLQALLSAKDIETLKSIGASVQRLTVSSPNAIEPPKTAVVSAIGNLIPDAQGIRDFDRQFRDKILRPCKLVQIKLKDQWWDLAHSKSELSRTENEWLTIKRACKFVVFNVDTSQANLVEDTYSATYGFDSSSF